MQRRFLVVPLLLAITVLFSGCASLDAKKETAEKANAVRKGPESAPYRTITGFSSALRCMDNLFLDYGVRDVSVIVEDIVDQTKKVNAGSKDMLISAVSDMTKRSRAIKLVAYGQDSGNLIGFLNQAGRKNAYAVVPQYDIKGSITQFDENVIRKQTDAGVGLDSYLNLGVARNAAASIVGMDLTILSSEDLSVVPGVTSRNSVILFKEGKGIDGDATIKKFGVNYNMSLSKAEGQSQALRNLVELATIELFGKLTKTPYWTCLGSDTASEPVKEEVSDWFASMFANPTELVSYFQQQMRVRGYYRGAIDGEVNVELKDAITKYRAANSMSAEPKINLELFAAYLNTNHRQRVAMLESAPKPQAVAAKPAPTERGVVLQPPSAPALEPIRLSVTSSIAGRKPRTGEAINLTITPNQAAHVYCYVQDETQSIVRFYPNRFHKDTYVSPSAPLRIPGDMRFQLVANNKGIKETVACFGSDRDVAAELPRNVLGIDFEPLSVRTLDEVRDAFSSVVRRNLGEGYFYVEPQ
jgi:curli biogenesis system outer membrane secretion channel CsgG